MGITMKKLSLLAAVVLTGCTTAHPFYYNGKHYMVDDQCAHVTQTVNPDVVMCYDEDMNATGTRSSMSDIQVQAYYSKKNQATPFTNSFNNTVNCKKLGAFLNAEIRTFQGAVCPIGWLKV